MFVCQTPCADHVKRLYDKFIEENRKGPLVSVDYLCSPKILKKGLGLNKDIPHKLSHTI